MRDIAVGCGIAAAEHVIPESFRFRRAGGATGIAAQQPARRNIRISGRRVKERRESDYATGKESIPKSTYDLGYHPTLPNRAQDVVIDRWQTHAVEPMLYPSRSVTCGEAPIFRRMLELVAT